MPTSPPVLVLFARGALASWPLLLVAALAGSVLGLPVVHQHFRSVRASLRGALLALLTLLAVVHAAGRAWLCDDAFIAMRYAHHAARGHGLVWNVGERVEGYTDLLWVLALAAGDRVGLSLPHLALGLCLLAQGAVVLLLARLSRVARPGSDSAFPLAAMVFAGNDVAASFGTSGLETMAAAALLLLALERALCRAPFASGLAGLAAVLCHPDHLLPCLGLGAALLLEPDRRRTALRYALPFLLALPAWTLWRRAYYGDWLPNTFYAKAGAGSAWGQGCTYLAMSALACGAWAWGPLAVLGAVRVRATLLGRFALLGLLPYALYVARLGGDYMLGRLVVALLLPGLLLAEVGVRECSGWRRVAAAAALALAAVPVVWVPPHAMLHGVTDERTFAALSTWSPLRIEASRFWRAQHMTRAFRGAGVAPVLAESEIGMVGFYTDLPVLDCLGLTDRTVARQPLAQRGRPGHERLAEASYLRSRGVQLSRLPLDAQPWREWTRVRFDDGANFFLARYEPRLVGALLASGAAQVAPVPAMLDRLAAGELVPGAHDPAALWLFLERYYFSANPDPSREAAVRARLGVR